MDAYLEARADRGEFDVEERLDEVVGARNSPLLGPLQVALNDVADVLQVTAQQTNRNTVRVSVEKLRAFQPTCLPSTSALA